MATFTNQTKHLATFTNQTANTGSYSADAKTDFTYYINTEDSFRLLTESGVYLITEQAAPGRIYTNLAKS